MMNQRRTQEFDGSRCFFNISPPLSEQIPVYAPDKNSHPMSFLEKNATPPLCTTKIFRYMGKYEIYFNYILNHVICNLTGNCKKNFKLNY